ncbi:hypothetical protein [Microbispora sp. ATCC PTA-5024]|uniref:hypothetical protein n=1 Tax=Microbispora sp. ATCC PTA-5024 TaxID=316330 RepID=UPI0003DD5EE2|nr:hypothetical protein [Microbispora sp. ATCC PTA-5024]ETK30846.1 hypothetical protein MPTA5024_38155 [Microbispora sp. ATCC PTA-5024]
MRPLRFLSAAACAALAVSVAGCGGGGDDTAGAPAAAPSGASGAAASRAAFAECLRKNGVTLPSGRPTARPSGRPSAWPSGRPSGGFRTMSPEMEKAFQACRSLMPQGGFGGGGFGRNGGDPAAMQAFRGCMKDNGVTLGDQNGLRGLDRSDPKVAKAFEKCRVLLPTAAPSPSA